MARPMLPLNAMLVKEFMMKNPIAVRPDDSLYHAAQIMGWTETHHLVVTEGEGRVKGILSERDLLAYRVEHPDRDPRSTPLADAMQEKPQTASPESSLTEAAARLAQNQVDCLPVTEKGRLVGIVTRKDVLSAEVRSAMADHQTVLTAADVMTRDVQTASPDDFLVDAAALMSEAGVRHLPVVDEKHTAVGILSDRDIQSVLRNGEAPQQFLDTEGRELLVRDLMSKPPMRVWPHENCSVVAELFLKFHASAALVTTSDGTLLGIVSYLDLLRSMAPSARVEAPSASYSPTH